MALREERLGKLAREARPVDHDEQGPAGLAEQHRERLDDLVGACVELIEQAPRSLVRDSGEAGEAWDRFVLAVEALDPDLRTGSSSLTGRPVRREGEAGGPGQGPVSGGLSVSALASVAGAAARMQSRVEATGDEALLGAWDLFLASLLVSP